MTDATLSFGSQHWIATIWYPNHTHKAKVFKTRAEAEQFLREQGIQEYDCGKHYRLTPDGYKPVPPEEPNQARVVFSLHFDNLEAKASFSTPESVEVDLKKAGELADRLIAILRGGK